MHPGSDRAAARNLIDVFRAALKDLGQVEGRGITVEVRWGGNRTAQLPALAAEIVSSKPAAIVTVTSSAVAALKGATSSIPVVFVTAANPVEQGFVQSLSHPGGNITGVMLHSDLVAKVVEIVREALPRARQVAVLVHDPDRFSAVAVGAFQSAARRVKLEAQIVRIGGIEDLERAFQELRKADAVVLPQFALFQSHREQIIQRFLKERLPLCSSFHDMTEAGGLLSYETPREENYRRAAALMDKILRGAKPGDLPVEQPERFQLVVNRKTAKLIGVDLSPVTLLRADRIID